MSQTSSNRVADVEPHFENTVPSASPGHRLAIRFTGSGSEYFRIWIVNLLLTIVTLSLYHPWAKVRRLRYFYGNTLVGGQPLDFHGDPMKMLRGYLLVGAMVILYSVAGRFSPTAGLVAFVIIAAIWPALLKSSMRFRLANTSWRGLRFHFAGSIAGAYRALLPLFVPGLLILAALIGVPDPQHPPGWYNAFIGLLMLSLVLLGPWLWWNLKKYQHDHYALGPLQTELSAGRGAFYGVFLKTIVAAMAAGAVLAAVIGTVAVLGVVGGMFGTGRPGTQAAIFFGIVIVIVSVLIMQLVPRPYFTSRMQNLLWSRTGNDEVRFASALRFWPLLGLTLKNWLLMIVTLGLYWPFAAVATHRMQIQAVSVDTTVDPESLSARTRDGTWDAAGDAAGDLFGLDIGL